MSMYNYDKLSGKIVERFKTQADFAKAIGLSERSISLKLNGKLGWKQQEMAKSCELLGIEVEEIGSYFFNLRVQ